MQVHLDDAGKARGHVIHESSTTDIMLVYWWPAKCDINLFAEASLYTFVKVNNFVVGCRQIPLPAVKVSYMANIA